MEGELRISKWRVFQTVGAATAKLREPKHVRTRGRDTWVRMPRCRTGFGLVRGSRSLFGHHWTLN